jgi:uncharacterized membrane protein (UPF0127 family)
VTRGAWVAAIVAGLLFLVAIGVVLLVADDGDDAPAARPAGPVAGALDAATPSEEPFVDLTATTIRVGDRSLDVVLADEGDERYQGLREREDIGPYDGMLFVFDRPTSTSFTMSTVPVPLEIGFYDADGRVVDRLLMKPCADVQSRCPLYGPKGSFTYALETLKGDLPEGDLSA